MANLRKTDVKQLANMGLGFMLGSAGGKIGLNLAKMAPGCGLFTAIGGYLIGNAVGDLAAEVYRPKVDKVVDFIYGKDKEPETTTENKVDDTFTTFDKRVNIAQ